MDPFTLSPLQLNMLIDAVDRYVGRIDDQQGKAAKPFKHEQLQRMRDAIKRADSVTVNTL